MPIEGIVKFMAPLESREAEYVQAGETRAREHIKDYKSRSLAQNASGLVIGGYRINDIKRVIKNQFVYK